MKPSKKLGCLFTLVFLISNANMSQAQAPDFLNPLVADANTILLLHFEDDLADASANAAAITAQGKIQFLDNAVGALGRAVWVQNDVDDDSSKIIIPHTDALNLEGDFTIELWVSAVTYANLLVSNWWPRYPILIGKTSGAYWADKPWQVKLDPFQHRMYNMVKQRFEGQSWSQGWTTLAGTENSVQLLEWYHVVFVQDSTSGTVGYLLHDINGNLIDQSTGLAEFPRLSNSGPVVIGEEGWIGGFGRVNLLLDEIRISDVVRDYQFPPVVGDVKATYADRDGGNATPNETATISVDARTIGNNPLAGAPKLYYRLGSSGAFTEMDMAAGADFTWQSDIPAQDNMISAEYYIRAQTVNGDVITVPKEAEFADPVYNGVAWTEQEAMVLNVDFEGNQAVDLSGYGHVVEMHGDNIDFSTDVAPGSGGTTSLAINVATGTADTSYLEIAPPSPFINPTLEGYAIDFFFKSTSFDHASRHFVWSKNGLATVETFAPPDFSYAYRTNVGNVLDWPFELPLDKWMRVRMGRTFDFNFTEFYDESDSLIYVRTVFHSETLPPEWVEQRPHAHAAMTMGRRPRFELELNAHVLVDNVRFFNYPVNAPGALASAATLENTNLPANQGAEVSVTSTGGATWFLTQLMYRTDDGQFQAVDLTPVTAEVFSAELPGQPSKTAIEYFFRLEDNLGRTAVWPAELPPNDLLFIGSLSAADAEAQATTLDLNFDEGVLPVQNSSDYGAGFSLHGEAGDPAYSLDTPDTSGYSMEFDGLNMLRINSPFVATKDFTLDWWFKADSTVKRNGFMFQKLGVREIPWPNGTFWVREIGGPTAPKVEFRMYALDPAGSRKGHVMSLEYQVEKWYHAVAEVVEGDTMSFSLFDASGNLVAEDGKALPDTHFVIMQNDAPLGIGGIPDGQRATSQRWAGKIDNVKFSNHAMTITTDVDDAELVVPTEYSLSQNYPNPFNPSTTIAFALPTYDHVTLAVYDMLGRKVAELKNEKLAPGKYEVTWDATNTQGRAVATGVYFLRLRTGSGDFNKKMKMLLMR